MNPSISYPVLQVRPYGLLAYQRTEYQYPNYTNGQNKGLTVSEQEAVDENRNNKFYTGQMTDYAKKRLTRAINLLVSSAKTKTATHFKTGKEFKFKVNFITLTLPAPQKKVTDKELKKYGLDLFIKRMKRKYKLNSYVWRAERQKNGNLHFHIMSDTYIRFDCIQNDWNAVLQRWHFIDDFQKKHKHRHPNSTDIHSVQKIKNLAAYMVKYMSKQGNKNETIEGKLWDCSKNLKIKHNCELVFSKQEEQIWNEGLKQKGAKIITEELYSIIFLNERQMSKILKGRVLKSWLSYLRAVRTGEDTTQHEKSVGRKISDHRPSSHESEVVTPPPPQLELFKQPKAASLT